MRCECILQFTFVCAVVCIRSIRHVLQEIICLSKHVGLKRYGQFHDFDDLLCDSLCTLKVSIPYNKAT